MNRQKIFKKNILMNGLRHLPLLAFTLAEMLIVLGIVGIVAEMTIPSLIKNTQDMQFKSAAKEAYSKAYQALQQIESDTGDDINTIYAVNKGYDCGQFALDFMTYFKVAKDCGEFDCVGSDEIVAGFYTGLSGQGAYLLSVLPYQFITVDGMFWAAGTQSWLKGIVLTVDVNGYLKRPNVVGRDVFMFEIINNSLVPMGAPNTDYPVPDFCSREVLGEYDPDSKQGFGCMYYVVEGVKY